MSKALIFFSIFLFALMVESRPSSNIDVACVGCDTKEIISRTKRTVGNAEGVLNSISGLVGNILHENWVGIERTSRNKRPVKNIYIGNGRNNKNKVYINRRRDEYDDY